MVRGNVMSVSPVEGTLVTVQLDPTNAFAVGRRLMTDATERKEAVIFMFYENKLLDLSAEIQYEEVGSDM
jgi:hypothetical protein